MKTLTVGELKERLKLLDQTLPVYYVMFDDGYNIVPLTEDDIVVTVLENSEGEIKTLTLGEGWLL